MSDEKPAEVRPEMPVKVTSPRLTYRPLSQEDWPFCLAVSQDRSVMNYISDPRSAEEIRTRSFDVPPASLVQRLHTLAVPGH